jgi:hypothetical protein
MIECDKCLEYFNEHETLGVVLKGEDYVISICEKCLVLLSEEVDEAV